MSILNSDFIAWAKPLAPQGPDGHSGFLIPSDLEILTTAWELWAASATTSARKLARARAHLLFLLIRYGGLRLAEALNFQGKTHLSLETGVLRVSGAYARDIFLPFAAMRQLRRILALPGAREKDFARLDPGFIRRTFYAVAKTAGLDSARGGPRSIRYARGLELLDLHMPPDLAREFLGLSKAEQMEVFLRFGLAGRKDGSANWLLATVEGMEPGARSVALDLKTPVGLRFGCLCAMDIFMKLEPCSGQTMWASVPPRSIFLAQDDPGRIFSNRIACRVASIARDAVESRIGLECAQGQCLAAHVETAVADALDLKKDQQILACFSARAVILSNDSP